MAFTKGIGPVVGTGSASPTNLALNGANAPTAGRSLVVGVVWSLSGITLTSVTLTGESNLTRLTTQTGSVSGVDYSANIAYLSNITSSGNKTVGCNFSGTPDAVTLFAIELIGGDTSALYDNAEAGAAGTSASPSVNIVTNTANACIVGLIGAGNSTTNPGGNYTRITLTNVENWEEGSYDLDAGAAGTIAYDWSLGGSAAYVLKCAAFKLAGGATTRGTPFGHRGTAFNGGRTFHGILQRNRTILVPTLAQVMAVNRSKAA